MSDFSSAPLFIVIVLAVGTSPFTARSEFVITNGPRDTTVCITNMANCACGFDGANPLTTIPDWSIVTRTSDGSFISNITYYGVRIAANEHAGLMWTIGQTGATSSPNSKLVFGPVNMTHNQSSYQCVFRINPENINGSIRHQIVRSSIGTLTVVGPPSIGNIVVNEVCATSLSISWDIHNSMCRIKKELVTISLSGDARTFPTTENNYLFTDLNSSTSYDITVTLIIKIDQFTTRSVTIKTSPSHSPPTVAEIVTETDNNDIKITWKVPEINCSVPDITHYNVTVLTKNNSTSKNITEEMTYLSNFVVYQSNISYTVIIAAVNSEGSSEITSKIIGVGNKKEGETTGGGSESNTAVVAIVVIIIILIIIVVIIATMILLYWKYHHSKEGDSDKKTSKLPIENSYVESSNTNDNSDLAYAITGPSSMFVEHHDTINATVNTDSSIYSTVNNEDTPSTPPQLPPKLNYAELQLANDQLPATLQTDTHVTYAKTIPA